jgi:hypothetical protein
MNTPADSGSSEFFLIARDPDGNYLAKVEEILHEHGIDQFTETTRRRRSRRPDAGPVDPDPILDELSRVLPASVRFVEDDDGESPFLVLEVDTPTDRPTALAACECKCGSAYSCAGGGGGH